MAFNPLTTNTYPQDPCIPERDTPQPAPFSARAERRPLSKRTGRLQHKASVTVVETPSESEKRTAKAASLDKPSEKKREKRPRRFETINKPSEARLTDLAAVMSTTAEILPSSQREINPAEGAEDSFFSAMQQALSVKSFLMTQRSEPIQAHPMARNPVQFKRALIINIPNEDMSASIKNLMFNGEYYPIEQIGTGTYHNVYQFITDKKLEINGVEIPMGEVVVKALKGNLGPKTEVTEYKNDLKAMLDAENAGVPIPRVFVRPDQVQDPIDPKNGFWIIEKMADPVSADEHDAFEFARAWLLRSVVENKELINDLYARNLMRNKEGEIKVVDCGVSEVNEKDAWDCDFTINLASYLYHWSLNGDPLKLSILMEGYPAHLQKAILEKIQERKLSAATSQLTH
ncbi:hypothetical protein [Estrella lausannensis]|uniref:Uncharacterized protein n=1 Tax=Estrella lausannensis TaxID=483423 RepID=A0A0H5DS46_9BACT|nr:hypothetical protein [Estrella lausannensis]CRX38554.1 hypothetical protein ELAC_1213 [Estrella lausannensis]